MAAAALLAGFVLETRVLPTVAVPVYHDLGLPLGVELPPIAARPTGEGDTASVRWQARDDRVQFTARPGERRVPAGLHGVVRFRETDRGQAMAVSWSPPWTFAGALVGAAVIATGRGEAALMVPVLVLLGGAVGAAYWTQARRVAIELRMAFSRGRPSSTPGSAPDRG